MHGRFVVLLSAALAWAPACRGQSATPPANVNVGVFALRLPGSEGAVEQASGLCIGRVGRHDGLWVVCDRNGGESANRILRIDAPRLAAARPGEAIEVSESLAVVGPADGWESFARRHRALAPDALNELRQQVETKPGGDEPLLDLEGITIGESLEAPGQPRLFVVAEQPNSLVLELEVVDDPPAPRARLVRAYAYDETPAARGDDANDGLEGIAWAGTPGEFYLVEEGTKPHDPSRTLLYFLDPRLMRATLRDGRVVVDDSWSQRATDAVRALRNGSTQTLNALTRPDPRTLLAVDRNGGMVLAVDVPSGKAVPWLGLYDAARLNLRSRLAESPGRRRMPYVSIEGIAIDSGGDLWLVDDPAMPEGFRASCLVRYRSPPPYRTRATGSRPAAATRPTRRPTR